MEVFNKSHVETIAQKLANSGLTSVHLQPELLDHYCCIVEEKMSEGKSFDDAYKYAWTAINPGGIHEIEEELFFLIYLNKQTTMNKMKYLGGFFAASFIALGFLFYILHWPGGKMFTVIGYASLLFTCTIITITAFNKHSNQNKMDKFRLISGNLTGILIATGSLFKAFHWPGANILLVVGFSVLILLYLPAFFHHAYKRSIEGA